MKHLKKLSFVTLLSLLMMNGVMANEANETKKAKEPKEKAEKVAKELSYEKQFNRSFNRWSLEVNGGFNALVPLRKTIVNPGANGAYSTSSLSPFHVDLGARFMINRIVGLKANIGYDQVSPGFNKIGFGKIGTRDISKVNKFKGHYYGFDIQAVVNLGQLFKFPEFVNRLGLLLHTGVGYRSFKLDQKYTTDPYSSTIKRDNIANYTWGLTPMLRVHDRIVLTFDFSQNYLTKQRTLLNGAHGNSGPIDALLHTYTLGMSFNLGKKEQHIDWAKKKSAEELTNNLRDELKEQMTADKEEAKKDIDAIKAKVDELSNAMNNYVTDKELDQLRSELNNLINQKLESIKNSSDRANELLDLTNKGLLATYFDFDSRQPQSTSLESIKYLAEYLTNNPGTKVNLTGYADATGTAAYNKKLSQDRANNVKSILVKQYGIDGARITTEGAGVDNNNDRNLARRVSFNITK